MRKLLPPPLLNIRCFNIFSDSDVSRRFLVCRFIHFALYVVQVRICKTSYNLERRGSNYFNMYSTSTNLAYEYMTVYHLPTKKMTCRAEQLGSSFLPSTTPECTGDILCIDSTWSIKCFFYRAINKVLNSQKSELSLRPVPMHRLLAR